jgi:ABC-type nitrate/sulfonate/bicarbonate transport system substrate-binding protein
MLYCMEQYGDPNKLNNNLVVMSNEDAVVAVSSGSDITGAIVPFPYNAELAKAPGVSCILDLQPIFEKYNLGNCMIANKDFFLNNPVLIEIVYEAFRQTAEYIDKNIAEAADILSEVFEVNVPAAIFEETLKDNPSQLDISESAYDKLANLMYEVGMLENPPAPFSSLPNYESIPKVP